MPDITQSYVGGKEAVERFMDAGDGTHARRVAAMGTTPRVTASFIRPAQALAYADVDIIANSLTAASVVPITFDVTGPSGRITGARCVVARCVDVQPGPTCLDTLVTIREPHELERAALAVPFPDRDDGKAQCVAE